jgi:AcrR family transcriptional regulator
MSRIVTFVKMCYDGGMPSPEAPTLEHVPSRRERVRAATIQEIKATAMRMLREHGADLRFADIARDMGMTAPALYRYFADRDELLSALMADGFAELSAQFAAALDRVAPDDLAGRVRAAAVTYRDFARADPSRFSLMFGLPNPGFGTHGQHTSGPAAGGTMAILEELVRSVLDHGSLPPPLVRAVGPALRTEAATAQAAVGARIPADAYQALLHFLAAVHGFACLENFDHLNWISDAARDDVFDAQIQLLTLAMGASPAGSQST